MSAADTLILAWHGSRNPAGRDLIERIARRVSGRLPGVDVRVAWVDIEPIQLAETLAEVGDCVLLSPACASLDMYKNYAHRAQAFIDAVQGLQP